MMEIPAEEIEFPEVANVERTHSRRYYFEFTSLDGRLDMIDVHGPARFTIFDALTRQSILCHVGEEMLGQALGSIRKRVNVEGKAKVSRSGKPISMEVHSMRTLKGPEDLAEFPADKTINVTGSASP